MKPKTLIIATENAEKHREGIENKTLLQNFCISLCVSLRSLWLLSAFQFPKMPSDIKNWDVLVGRVKGRWDHAKLRIAPFSQAAGRFGQGAVLCVAPEEGARRLLKVRESEWKNGAWICDCDLRTSEEAEALKGADILIDRSMRPELAPGEFYSDQLIGMRVQTENGEDWGEIEEILESSAHETFVTARALIPDVPEWVLRVDGQTRIVTVKSDPGLLR